MRWVIIAALLAIVLIELTRALSKEGSRIARSLTGLAAVSSALIAVVVFYYTTGEDDSKQVIGVLKPRYVEHEAAPLLPATRFADKDSTGETRLLHEFTTGLLTLNVRDGESVLPLGIHVPFSIRKTKEGLLVSMVMRSLDGKVIARLFENEWVLNPNQYYRRNFDDSALEVIDEFGLPALQIEYIDPVTVRFGGVFHTTEARVDSAYPDFPIEPIASQGTVRIQYPRTVAFGQGLYTGTNVMSDEEIREFVEQAGKVLRA